MKQSGDGARTATRMLDTEWLWCQLSLLLVCQWHRLVDLFSHGTGQTEEADLSSAWKMLTHVLTIWKPKKIQDSENISKKSVLESSGKIVTNTLRKENLIWNVFLCSSQSNDTVHQIPSYIIYNHPQPWGRMKQLDVEVSTPAETSDMTCN